jgi:hypothetical protein
MTPPFQKVLRQSHIGSTLSKPIEEGSETSKLIVVLQLSNIDARRLLHEVVVRRGPADLGRRSERGRLEVVGLRTGRVRGRGRGDRHFLGEDRLLEVRVLGREGLRRRLGVRRNVLEGGRQVGTLTNRISKSLGSSPCSIHTSSKNSRGALSIGSM